MGVPAEFLNDLHLFKRAAECQFLGDAGWTGPTGPVRRAWPGGRSPVGKRPGRGPTARLSRGDSHRQGLKASEHVVQDRHRGAVGFDGGHPLQ